MSRLNRGAGGTSWARRGAALVALSLLVAGCTGQGQGWVEGELWVENCSDGDPLGGAAAPAPFDLRATFFAGETLEDSNPQPGQKQNRLDIRIQDTSNNVEASNGLLLQLLDLEQIARAVAQGQPIPISNCDLCRDDICASAQDVVRAKLYLFAICPSCQQPMLGSAVRVSESQSSGGSGRCLQAERTAGESCPKTTPACPVLDDQARATLQQLCRTPFTDRSTLDTIRRTLGGGACIYFCQLGELQPGSDAELAGFNVTYGDQISAFFSSRIVDGRAVKLGGCARINGTLHGRFSFSVSRGRAAQSFP